MAERLQKYLARAGVASRRHAEELITAGRVMVNNQKVTELGSRVEPGTDLVSVDGELVSLPETSSYYLLYKPAGVVTTLSDPQGRPTVASYVEATGKRLFPVGRLDYDAEGALLFTDDGTLAHKLTHPSFQVPRTYLAKVKGSPDRATLEKLRGGVRLEDGMATPLSVDLFEQAERNTWLKIVVAEGRPHLIKRLCAAVGHPVVRLFRPAYAGVGVSGVRPGELRPLTSTEVRLLQDVAEARTAPPEGELNLPPRRHGRAAPGFEEDEDGEGFEVEGAAAAPAKPSRSPAAAKTGRARPAAAGRPERKPAGKSPRTEGGTGLARFGRTSSAAVSEEGSERPRRSEWKKSEGSARPERKSWAPRGEGADRPERKEWKPRGEGTGRPERKAWAPRGEGADRPERKEWKPRGEGAGRPERKAWAPRGEPTDRPERKEWKPRGEGAGRPERKAWAPRGEPTDRPERKEWKPRGEGAGRPERKEWKPRGEGAGRPERKAWAPRGEPTDRPERKEWKPRGEGAGRPERKEWKPRSESADRPERKAWAPRGESAGRPERKEWKPRGESAGRPERRERAPRAEGTERPRSPRFGGAAAEGRPARTSPRAEGGEEGGKGFVDWNKTKKRGQGTSWDSHRSSPGGSRGPRKPAGPRRPR
ncbi:pseudouridine synthase [Stigmatella aurantiaca]|uniref:Pseudouridine synthase n=1 Tax=Stigmatella aurantiaca (strain DW4/3-1) TaxID=378806 RepID=Q08MY5_STIAD|nr:pseudouridine synthase [Stigmatella aurantiaca]ADO72148.1 Pseudouridine synthase [Stigmatella aurantiaca DW4/3-1]EAU61846.1 ribosomal large subunit pseudouridine synthase B [Stigmatella aurantiaca DW4/3-1]